jgi:HEPN domain-containing protein
VTPSGDIAVWWIRTAIGDLADARAIADADEATLRGAAYHAHQAAEKALKAAISFGGVDAPRIHDLVLLGASLHGLFDGSGSPPDLTRLSAAVITARYPDPDDPPYDPDEVERLIVDAETVLAAVRTYLAARGLEDAPDLTGV